MTVGLSTVDFIQSRYIVLSGGPAFRSQARAAVYSDLPPFTIDKVFSEVCVKDPREDPDEWH